MKYTFISILLTFTVFLVNAQESEKMSKKEQKMEKLAQQKETVKKMIEGKSFVFEARNAFSSTAGNVNINYPYNVKLTNDSIYSYLPFYGRAYRVEYGSTESPMVFDLPFQELEIIKKKKMGYLVDVKVKKDMDIIVFSFNISDTGSATLTVNSADREVITYYGELTAEQKEDKSL